MANLALAGNPFYLGLLAAQVMFYSLAGFGYALERQGNVAVQDVSVEGALPRRQRHGLEDRAKSPVVEHYPGSPATTLRM